VLFHHHCFFFFFSDFFLKNQIISASFFVLFIFFHQKVAAKRLKLVTDFERWPQLGTRPDLSVVEKCVVARESTSVILSS